MGARRKVTFRRVAVLGTGRAGSALLHSLTNAAAEISTVVVGNRGPVAFAPPGARTARGVARTADAAVAAQADVLFVAVSDGALGKVAAQLARRPALPPLIAHLSGAQGREALSALDDRTQTAAFHPLAALDPARPIPAGTVVGISAAPAPLAQRLVALAALLGLRGERVKAGSHARYHLGASIAANLPVALLAEATQKLKSAGLDEEAALAAAVGLMRSAVTNAQSLLDQGGNELGAILTGPIARGDVSTVARHLNAMPPQERSGDLGEAYRSLSRRLLALAPLNEPERTALAALLSEANKALLD